jgi:hypothetical protein
MAEEESTATRGPGGIKSMLLVDVPRGLQRKWNCND